MKKVIILIFIFVVIIILSKTQYSVSDDSIRYRVIANSNSTYDILMKERVVNELSNILFKENQTKEQVKETIYNNLENIELKINNLFKKYNYNKKFNIIYGINYFPQKEFLGKKYSKGYYDSLVIEIGEAKGNNYFCVLYPSLCIIDYNGKKEYGFKIKKLIEKIF